MSTKQQRIAELAKQAPDTAFTSLNHHVNVDWLREAFRRTRKDGASGIDGVTAETYQQNLAQNMQDLLGRAKSGRYQAPAVKRVYIPKGIGSKEQRPIGIPTFEDKLLQRAVVMLLEPIYEQDFLDCSFGFRPGRSQHQALQFLWKELTTTGRGWVLEIDIRKFFDTLSKTHFRDLLQQRVRDGAITRLIGKWMNAGVLEDKVLSYPEAGTPQGGVISPLASNIYLHYVLDAWFQTEVKPRLRGRASLVRFADDAVIVFKHEEDARRVFDVLSKRFAKYGLALHPEKTRLLPFGPPRGRSDENKPMTFDFLGFTHYWGRSCKGKWIVKRKTAKDRLQRGVKKISEWCRLNRFKPIGEQQKALRLKLQGHYNYFGITGNFRSLWQYYTCARSSWHKWLCRRSQKSYIPWEKFLMLENRFPLPSPKVVHSIYHAAKP